MEIRPTYSKKKRRGKGRELNVQVEDDMAVLLGEEIEHTSSLASSLSSSSTPFWLNILFSSVLTAVTGCELSEVVLWGVNIKRVSTTFGPPAQFLS